VQSAASESNAVSSTRRFVSLLSLLTYALLVVCLEIRDGVMLRAIAR